MWELLVPLLGKVFDRVLPDQAARDAANLEILKLAQTGELAQLNADVQLATNQTNVNIEEAKSENIFKSGWRPWIGWVCGTGFGIQFVIGPLGEWSSALLGHPVKFPQMDLSQMMPLLFGMLGLGTLRSVEKIKGLK